MRQSLLNMYLFSNETDHNAPALPTKARFIGKLLSQDRGRLVFTFFFPLVELYLPLVVLFIAIYSLLSTNFSISPKLASSYAWLGLFTFLIRIPMIIVTPVENELGRVLIVVLGVLSAFFFYCALRIGQTKPQKRKSKSKK